MGLQIVAGRLREMRVLQAINQAGGLLGREVELRIGDNASTNPGTVLAFSDLPSDGQLAGIIGPIRSTRIQAVAPR